MARARGGPATNDDTTDLVFWTHCFCGTQDLELGEREEDIEQALIEYSFEGCDKMRRAQDGGDPDKILLMQEDHELVVELDQVRER